MAQINILPYIRKGLSNSITTSGTAIKKRADLTVKMGVELTNKVFNETELTYLDGQVIQLQGPADVKSVNACAISMISPTENSSVQLFKDYMPFIEFYEEDLPWRYTPVSTDDEDFHPWMALIAVKEEEVEFSIMQDSTKLAALQITSEERYQEIFPNKELLPKLAHVQIDSEKPIGKDNVNALLEENPDCGISRLLCTSLLDVDTSYWVLLVPAYELGRLAALGKNLDGIKLGACSWSKTLSEQLKKTEGLTFPLYKKWKFRTSEIPADFKTLASRLFFTGNKDYENMTAYLDVDFSQSGLKDVHYDDEKVVDVPVALTLDKDNSKMRVEDLEHTNALKELLELNPVLKENETGDVNMEEDPWIVPPIYGAHHLLTTQSSFTNTHTDVVKEVNLKLQNRIAAGLGSTVVKKNQEEFVNRAWKKVEKITQLNQAIREYSQMQQVDAKTSNKHKIVKETVVEQKNRALLMDVAQRNVQAASIYRNNISADTLLETSQQMPKAMTTNQRINCGITVNELKGIYSTDMWSVFIENKELRNHLANDLDFYETFPDYYPLSDLGLKVGKDNKGNFCFMPTSNSLKTPIPDPLLGNSKFMHTLGYFSVSSVLTNYLSGNELVSLLEFIANRKNWIDRRIKISGNLTVIPIVVHIDGEMGIIVPDMKEFSKISQDKPIRIKCKADDKTTYGYVLPLSYVTKQNNLRYEIESPHLSSPIEVIKRDGKFVPVSDSFYWTEWLNPNKSNRHEKLSKICEELKKGKSSLEFSLDKGTKTNTLKITLDYKKSLSKLTYNGFTFSFHINEKRFQNIVKVDKNNKKASFNCKKLAEVLSQMLEELALLEELVWEPTTIFLSNVNTSDFEEVNAETIINTIPHEPIISADKDPFLKKIKSISDYIDKELKIKLQPDENLIDIHVETINPTRLGRERINEIATKYGYTEQNQLESHLDSKYPVMAYPDFLDPTFFYLREMSTDYVIPSAGDLLKNSITYFTTNAKFEEAYLMGMNTEMGRELLWREYPTDQRGSYFRKFWDQEFLPTKEKLNEYYDVKPLHQWKEALGKNHMIGKDGMLVFAIRSELMQSYPNTRIYLSNRIGQKLQLSKLPEMASWLNEETYLVGFEGLTSDRLQGYYLTFEQEPLSLQFERDKGEHAIHGEFMFATPHIYAIPLENRSK